MKPKVPVHALLIRSCGFLPIPLLALLFLPCRCAAASYYPARLDDPKAVHVQPPSGKDDTALLQQAIDKVQETAGQGIVFLQEGRYRITGTVHIWPGIRLIGYGANRPLIILPANTPGFQDVAREKVLFFFAGSRPGSGPGRRSNPAGSRGAVPDANPGTFYSALSNVDVEIEDGNHGAVAVRSRYAQHCFLAHIEFRLGPAIAGVHEAGNVMEDVRFLGGSYGIWTSKPSPSWQLTVIDATFENQRIAAIREREAGLTLVRPCFRNVAAAVHVEEGCADELWIKDARLENVTGPAFVFGVENNPRNEVNMEGISCKQVPVFASLRESGRRFSAPSDTYCVKVFSHGLHFSATGGRPQIRTVFNATPASALVPAVDSDLPDLPRQEPWVNARDLGARGDGETDDTEALQKAIAAHRCLYLPSGFYIVRDTLELRPDTVLIGLHPGATQILLPDRTPAYQGVGEPRALLEAPKGGSNIVIGIGLHAGGVNPRAVAALWKAGSTSLMNDVRFLGGHGTPKPDGSRENPYNDNHTADPDPARQWDSQYPSLWVTDGGGGTFLDLWTPSTFARAGMLVSDTQTQGRVYAMSSEHHVQHEVQIRNSAHWSFYALQTEEERGESGNALPLEIEDSHDITIANFHVYRVISMYQRFRHAIRLSRSSDIRFRNIHCYSNSKVSFDSTVYDQTHNLEIRQREFAWLDLSGTLVGKASGIASAVLARDAKVEKLAGGFYNISGGVTDAEGRFYFVDSRWQHIHRWDPRLQQLTTVSDIPGEPVNLAADRAGNLMVVSSSGKGVVYSLSPEGKPSLLKQQAITSLPGKEYYLPVSDWRLNRDSLSHPSAHFLSPDGTSILPVAPDFLNGATSWGVKSSPQIRSFGLTKVTPGQSVYICDEAELTTWEAKVGTDGSLRDFRLFADQGGEGTAVDARGNVYIAAGQVFVYSPAGKLLATLEVPERPTQLVFGGADRRTLFIPARTSLYAARTRFAGR